MKILIVDSNHSILHETLISNGFSCDLFWDKSVNELNFNDKRRVEEYKISQRVISFSKKNRINTKKALLWCLKNSNKVIIGFSEAHQLTSIIKQNQLK